MNFYSLIFDEFKRNYYLKYLEFKKNYFDEQIITFLDYNHILVEGYPISKAT
jgi:hypothetical protein